MIPSLVGTAMKQRILAAVLAVLIAASGKAAEAAPAFLAEFEDLPLPQGLSEVPGGIVFDTPQGRIVDISATGRVGVQTVLSFYAQTLPQLGWTPMGANEFQRDNETLRIDVDADGNATTVRFSVKPH